jgi:flagellar basal-body rod protein FlgG
MSASTVLGKIEKFMIDAISVSTSALRAQQQQIDVISNNLANMQTPGFKRGRVNFSALASQGPSDQGNPINASKVDSGHGTEMQAVNMVSEQGAMRQSGGELDLGIDGRGFFEVKSATGQMMYTRAGQFQVDEEGYLATVNGLRLAQDVVIPEDAKSIEIRPNGEVVISFSDRLESEVIDKIQLVNFASPDNLLSVSGNAYMQTATSGEPITGFAGEQGFGSLQQGVLEQSNVNLIEEMSNLVMAQRAYQLNARVLQASDQVLETINNLRR